MSQGIGVFGNRDWKRKIVKRTRDAPVGIVEKKETGEKRLCGGEKVIRK